jgi:hypothetical protein
MRRRCGSHRLVFLWAVFFCLLLRPVPALAWGDEGHKIVALIAGQFLTPAVKQKIDAMLAADTDPLTAHDIADEATWADRYRDADYKTSRAHYLGTRQWHWIDIELDRPDLDAACYGHPAIPAGKPASAGPADDCIIDKIDEFTAELSSKTTSLKERLIALKFLLHLVGDLHAPLHAADNHDHGASTLKVSESGGEPTTLHNEWNQGFLDYLGDEPAAIADDLVSGITQSKGFDPMSKGTTADWAMESFTLARDNAYGKLPPKKPDGSYDLPPDYVTGAIETIRVQLARAGVRLAVVLNRALS